MDSVAYLGILDTCIYYRQRTNMFTFIELLRTENTSTLTRLRTFIFKAFGIRNIYNYT